ncbi:MAG: hypothetical protein H6937_08685 [Burkholderiales bacterium]|nr:hypothetical protein [Burkholderiales bacterium]MDR4517176.1 hypothetical protein [Nitrosomonas sp.]
MSGIQEQLFNLQIAQLGHDELFHKEITRLSIHQRLNHMALHFAKYSGKICDCILNNPNEQTLKRVVIDSFIISVTCANILNLRISDRLIPSDKQKFSSLDELGNDLIRQLGVDIHDSLWLIKAFPVVAGEFAKACESVDHLESFRYRESMIDSVTRICSLILVAASQLKVDLVSETPLRLNEVKKKSIFFDHYTNL